MLTDITVWISIGLSAVLSVGSIVIDSLLIASSHCLIEENPGERNSSWEIFMREHIRLGTSNRCQEKGLSETFYYNCSGANIEESETELHSFVDPQSVSLFLIVHLTLHGVWLFCSTLGIWFGASSKRWNFLWLCSTTTVLLYAIVMVGLFSVEIQDLILCYENFEDQVDFLKNNAIAKLILPVYFSQGIIFWLATSILWCLVLKKTACAKEESDNDSTANFTETLNKRFDQAENIEEHESGGSHDSVVARRSPHVLPRHRDASTEWVYSNPAMVKDFDFMTSKERLPEVTYASPQSFLTRSVSKESENSEGRRIGRPLSMPPIDYKLPRASLTPSSGAPRNEKQPRKAIRTPSGRSMSAMEYLRGGYRPSEKSLPEEEKDVHRYFVKLKE